MKRTLYVMETDGSVRQAVSREEFITLMGDDLKKSLYTDDVYGICSVSTSFLGAEPLAPTKGTKKRSGRILFETLVSGGPIDGLLVQYSTYEDATKGHKNMIQKIKSCIN